MQDRFKFRTYDKRTKEMLNVRLISYFNTGNICRVEAQNAVGDIIIFDDYKTSIEDIELMQCTGLKDKNGKLIYESDIVDVLPEIDEIAIIEFDNEEAKFVINHFVEKYISTFENYYGKDLEVIGNIYENEELLNGTNA